MLSNYSFLTDHSYSLRPEMDDKQDKMTRKRTRSSNRTTKNRIASTDRSLSDKENNLNISSNSNHHMKTNSKTKTKPSQKKTSIGSGRTRVSKQTSSDNLHSSSAKTAIKSTSSNIVKRKKTTITNRNQAKSLTSFQVDSHDFLPLLSIEERVKLRRTQLLPLPIKTTGQANSKQTNKSKPKSSSTVKNKKSFLGSGLDLDNIVLGSRKRRSVQT